MAKRHYNRPRALYLADTQDLLPSDHERDNKCSSPLSWGKFRTPATPGNRNGGPSRARHELYSMRRSAIKSRADGFAVLGVYDEILIYYGLCRRAALRGWLVNHLYQPATAAQIASVIGCQDVALVRRALAALTAEGLLIWVWLADLARADLMDVTVYPQGIERSDPPKTDDPDDDRADDRPKGREAGANDRPQGREAAVQGEVSEKGENARRKPDPIPLPTGWQRDGNRLPAGCQPDDVIRETGDWRLGDARPPPAASAAPSPLSADGYGRPEDLKPPASAAPAPADGQTADALTGDALTGDGQTADGSRAAPGPDGPQDTPEPPEPPDGTHGDDQPVDRAQVNVASPDAHGAEAEAAAEAAAEADEPTEADPGQGAQPPTPRPAGPDMSWHAESMAQQVMDVLYPDRQALVEQGRRAKNPQGPDEFQAREIASFRNAFAKALPLLDQVGAMRLIRRCLQEAQRSWKVKCRTTRGRYWCWWFGLHMASVRRSQAGASGPP